jgi:hypothetical protein
VRFLLTIPLPNFALPLPPNAKKPEAPRCEGVAIRLANGENEGMYTARFISVLQLLALVAKDCLAGQPNTPPETQDAGYSSAMFQAGAKASKIPRLVFAAPLHLAVTGQQAQ